MSVLSTGLRWIDLVPNTQNHISSGDPINDPNYALMGLGDSRADNLQKEEQVCVQGLGENALDQSVAERDPAIVAHANMEFNMASFKREEEGDQLWVNGMHGTGLRDELVRAIPPQGELAVLASLFGSIGESTYVREGDAAQEEQPSMGPAGGPDKDDERQNPFVMRAGKRPAAEAFTNAVSRPTDAMYEAAKADNIEHYFQEAKAPFSQQGQHKIDAKESLGLRSKYLKQNDGSALRAHLTEAQQADAALDQLSSFNGKDQSQRGKGKDLHILAARGHIDEETQNKNFETLRFEGSNATAIQYGVGDLGRQSFARFKSQKTKKGHVHQNEYVG